MRKDKKDEKMLIVVIVTLLSMFIIRFAIPEINVVFGMEFAMFFVGCYGLMVLMHYLGFIEAFDEIERGQK